MKILQIFGEPIANGGEESFVMNMYECIDKKRLQFDLFTPYYCENVNTKKKIESYGGKVIVRNKRFNSKLRKLLNIWLALRLQLNVNFLKVYVSKKSIKL